MPFALFRRPAVMAMLATLTASCSPHANLSSGSSMIASPCFKTAFPRDIAVTLLGAHRGGILEKQGNPAQGNERRQYIKVWAGAGGKPTVLVLMGFNEITWDLSEVAPGRILAIATYGHRKQLLINAPTDIPVKWTALCPRDGCDTSTELTPGETGDTECDFVYPTSKGGLSLDEAIPVIEKMIGLKVITFHGAYAPPLFNIDEQPYFDSGPLSSYPYLDDRNEVPQSLVEPIKQGIIRPASLKDIAAWNNAVTAKLKTGYLAPYLSQYLRPDKAYVVLKPFVVPRGMLGVNSREFIVLAGVPKPQDANSHNRYYFMDGPSCTYEDDCRRFPWVERAPNQGVPNQGVIDLLNSRRKLPSVPSAHR